MIFQKETLLVAYTVTVCFVCDSVPLFKADAAGILHRTICYQYYLEVLAHTFERLKVLLTLITT